MSIGDERHLVRLQNPVTTIPDGDGGFTQTWADLTPATWHVSITPATARDLERVAAGTVLSTATYILRGKFHPQVTTQTRVLFGARAFSVTGDMNPGEQNIDMILVCVEVVS